MTSPGKAPSLSYDEGHYRWRNPQVPPGRWLVASLPLSPVASVPPLGVVGNSGIAAGAEVLGHQLPALLAAHRAAPVELAVAAADHLCPPLLHFEAALCAEPPATPPLPLREVPAGL